MLMQVNARNHNLVGVADVERVIEAAELCEDAASEPVMVMDEDAKKPRGRLHRLLLKTYQH